MKKNNKTQASHIREILTSILVTFVILKLVPGTDVYNWSWWAVTSPIWVPFALFIFIFLISALYYLVVKHDWSSK